MLGTAVWLGLTAGCWDRTEIGDRLYVLSLVVDQAAGGNESGTGQEGGGGSESFYRTGVEVGLWKLLKGGTSGVGGVGGGGGQGKGGGLTPEKPTWVMASTAETVAKSLDQLHKRSRFVVSLSHLQVIILGESMIRKGIAGTLDFLERDPEVQRRVDLVVTPGEGLDLLQASPPVDQLVATTMPGLLDATARAPYSINTSIGEVTARHHAKACYLIPRARRSPDGVVLGGAAVFRRDKFVGWLGEEECCGYNWITGKADQDVLQYRVPGKGPEEFQVFRVMSGRRRLKLVMSGGKPVFKVSFDISGDLEESAVAVATQAEVKKVRQTAAEALRRKIEKTVAAEKRLKAEFCGFGELVRETQPKLWDRVKDRWDDYFASEARVEVKVRATLRHHGEIR